MVSRMYAFLLTVIPIFKIAYGISTSVYFQNAAVGSWWIGIICLLIGGASPPMGKKMWFVVVVGVLRIINLALAIFASALDIRVAVYFSTTIKECDLSEGIPCFCDSSKKGFDDTFRQWGSYSCDNVFTRNPDNLVANAVFTLACALLLFSYLVTFLLSLPSGPPCAP